MPSLESVVDSLTDSRVVVVSNREPYVHTSRVEGVVERPVGGLTAALDEVMRSLGGTWVAWGSGDADFEVADEHGRVAVPPGEESYDLVRVRLSPEAESDYYYGYSNQVLWPLCHHVTAHLQVRPGFWSAYRDVNETFAERTVETVERGGGATDGGSSAGETVVWFQDYHLALAPRYVRRSCGDRVSLQQFWHIPWPTPAFFEYCPHTKTLLRGLLGNDRIGFHTDTYVERFCSTVERYLPEVAVDHDDRSITVDGRTVDPYACPVGVRPDRVRAVADGDDATRFWANFRARHGIGREERVAVAVDRLDYTKGICRRLDAYEHLLETRPRFRGSLRLVQKASETRAAIPAYQRYQQRVRSAVRRVNDRFGTDDWTPVTYVEENLDRAGVVGLLANADLGVVTPTVDGLNLVAKEFVAAAGSDSALVLSEHAGVHSLLGESAYSVTPFDTAAFADTLERGLDAPESDRRRRHAALAEAVGRHDIGAWVQRGLDGRHHERRRSTGRRP